MKVYLVGGAVRDQLLGYPVKERDWVVVGGTPDELLQQGYIQVGKDFPVFLHPVTQEEYALARTERKSGPGYYGFKCDFNPHVSLQADLLRRDLTVNAMAMDENGTLIDPFHGLDDLQAKRLCHVSDAFIEDPVRVLRVARFVARYHHLGFTLADKTQDLMRKMVQQDELLHLVPERVWQEFSRSLQEKNPEQFIGVLRACGALKVVIPELDMLFGYPMQLDDNVVMDSGLAALNALEKITSVSQDPIDRFAALCHVIGKGDISLVDTLCHRLKIPKKYEHLARLTAQFYHQIQQLPVLGAEGIVDVLEHCDAFRRPQIFLKLVFICDAIALKPSERYAQRWANILDICDKISVKSILEEGCVGEDIKKGLHQKRVLCVEALELK